MTRTHTSCLRGSQWHTVNDDSEWHRAQGALLVSASPGVEFRFDEAYLDFSAMLGTSLAHGGSEWDLESEEHVSGGTDDQTHAAVSLAFGYKL